MELALVLVREVFIMFLLIGVGVGCKKTGILDRDGALSVSNILLLIVIPALIICNFQRERIDALLPAMGVCFLMGIVMHLYSIFIANRLLPDKKNGESRNRIARLCAVFANAGFMGFPLLQATVGDEGMLYGPIFIGMFNVFSWGWAAPLMSGEKVRPLKLLRHPAMIAFALGILLHLCDFRLPGVADTGLRYLASVNTPLSMLIIGVFLADVNIKDAFRDKQVYLVVFLRNLLFPLLTLAILWAMRVSVWLPGGKTFALAFMIMQSCSTAASGVLMPTRYGRDATHGAKLTTATTLAVIVTLPLVVALSDYIL